MILRPSNFRDPGRMDVARHRGVDIVVLASSFHRNNKNTRSGIYELAYSIHRLLGEEEAPPPGGEAIPVPGHPRRGMVVAVPETVMWNYNRLPMPDQDRNLVAKDEVYPLPGTARISLFNLNRSNEDKHTSYVATNVDGDDGGPLGARRYGHLSRRRLLVDGQGSEHRTFQRHRKRSGPQRSGLLHRRSCRDRGRGAVPDAPVHSNVNPGLQRPGGVVPSNAV